jgi:hypothetical protein
MNPKKKRLFMARMFTQPFQSEWSHVFGVPAGIEKLIGSRERFIVVFKVVIQMG